MALGLPLFLKGHANIWFKSLRSTDDLTFDEISAALIERFASGADNWRLRLELSQRWQMENESVETFSLDIRNYCSRLGVPKSEWLYYFIQGLRVDIREHVILQQPTNLDEAVYSDVLNFETPVKEMNETCVPDGKSDLRQIIKGELSEQVRKYH